MSLKRVLVIIVLSVILSGCLLPSVRADFWWMPLGGGTLSSPAVAATEGGRVDVIVRGTDNRIYHKYRLAPTYLWSDWTSLGGTTYDQPAVAYLGEYLHVVVRGADNGIYHKRFSLPSGPWDSTWTRVGGATLSTPALAAYSYSGVDRLYMFVRGTDDMVYYNYYGALGWTSWTRVPGWTLHGIMTSDTPAIACCTPTETAGYVRIHLVIRGPPIDEGVWLNSAVLPPLSPLAWGTWFRFGQTLSAPTLALTVASTTYLNLAVRGMDSHLYYTRYYWTGTTWGWQGWHALGGTTYDRPAVATILAENLLYLFVRGTNNGVYFKTMNLSTIVWDAGWTFSFGSTASAPSAQANIVCVRGMDNRVYYG